MKRATTSTPNTPSKVPKADNLANLRETLSAGLNNIDTHLSAAAYKLSRNQVSEGKSKIDTCVNLVTAIKKQSIFKIKMAVKNHQSMAQRIHGLERNAEYLRADNKKLRAMMNESQISSPTSQQSQAGMSDSQVSSLSGTSQQASFSDTGSIVQGESDEELSKIFEDDDDEIFSDVKN